MGTSSSYGGPRGGTPLVPSWIDPAGLAPVPPSEEVTPAPGPGETLDAWDQLTPPQEEPQAAPDANRFRGPRSSFTRFSKSGGNSTPHLGRAVAGYVSRSAGGAKRAAQKMGAARASGARLLGFLADAQARGAEEALRTLRLEGLAGRPIEEVFLGLIDYVCPNGGAIDEGIARAAFIDTIADLAELGVEDLDTLTVDQMQTLFELYATHAIEARLCNEIGTKAIVLPENTSAIEKSLEQLRDFVRRAVSDALTHASGGLSALTPQNVQGFVDSIYEAAFTVLQALGENEAQA